MVSIAAFQAVDPGSIPGRRKFFKRGAFTHRSIFSALKITVMFRVLSSTVLSQMIFETDTYMCLFTTFCTQN